MSLGWLGLKCIMLLKIADQRSVKFELYFGYIMDPQKNRIENLSSQKAKKDHHTDGP